MRLLITLLLFASAQFRVSGQKLHVAITDANGTNERVVDWKTWRNTHTLRFIDDGPEVDLKNVIAISIKGIRYRPIDPNLIPGITTEQTSEGYTLMEEVVSGSIDLFKFPFEERYLLASDNIYVVAYQANAPNGDITDFGKREILEILYECKQMAPGTMNNLKVNKTQLRNAVIEYNQHCGELSFRQPGLMVRFGPEVGYETGSFKVRDDRASDNYLIALNKSDAIGLSIVTAGINVSTEPLSGKSHFGLLGGAHYSRIHGNATSSSLVFFSLNEHEVLVNMLDLSTLSVNIGPQYVVPGRIWDFYAGLQLGMNYQLSAEGKTIITRVFNNMPGFTTEVALEPSRYSKLTSFARVDIGFRVGKVTFGIGYVAGINEYFNVPGEQRKGIAAQVSYNLL